MLPRPEDVEAVTEALTNIMKTDPSLLFRAAMVLHNRIMSEFLMEIINGSGLNERRKAALKLRMELCQHIGAVLLRSNRVILDDAEKAVVLAFLQAVKADEHKSQIDEIPGAYWT